MESKNVPVGKLQANPYQTRFAESEERAREIALSIAQDGLLQPPTVREVDGIYQLAFGHTRTRAWQICDAIMSGHTDGYPDELVEAVTESHRDYSEMPVFIAEISDEKMFRHAVTENAQRSDLSPIEEAYAMKRAMDDFGYTSEAAGALFGKNGSTVRGKIRLLELPMEVRDLVHRGEMPESVARQLLSVAKIAPDKVGEAVEYLKENDEEAPDFAIANYIGHLDHTYEMWNDNRDSKNPRGYYSDKAWLINGKKFPNALLPVLDVETGATALGLVESADIELLARYLDDRKEALSQGVDIPEAWKATLNQLINPPLCSACDFYLRISGDHICGLRACHERKRAAWNAELLNKLSAKHGIAIYHESDGNYLVLGWEHGEFFKKDDPDLRLAGRDVVTGYHYQNFIEGSGDVAYVVAVGNLRETLNKRKKSKNKAEAAAEDADELRENILYRAYEALHWEAARICVGSLFATWPVQAVRGLWRGGNWNSFHSDEKFSDDDQRIAAMMMRHLIDSLRFEEEEDEIEPFDVERVEQITTYLTRKLGMLGIKAPKSFAQMAKQYEKELAVAVETQGGEE